MFWIINAILIFVALAFVLPSLTRKRNNLKDARREQNIFIANEQLKELETRFEQGEIDSEGYQASRDELEQSLFADVSESDQEMAGDNSKTSLVSAVFIALLIPLIAIPVYLKMGNPVFTTTIDSKQAATQELQKDVPKKADGTPDIDVMVTRLQKKMEADPKNLKGWYMLGRSYMVLRRYPDAAKAFEHAHKLKEDSADIMLSLADSLSMASNGNISGRPTELINKALEVEPDNMTGLWLGGMASRQQKDYKTAIKRWRLVLPQLKSAEETQEVKSLIADALKQLSPEDQAAIKATDSSKMARGTSVSAVENKNADQSKTQAEITVTISLSEELKSQVSPTDYLFIYAKAMSGPPMPLAAVKKQVSDLPLQIVLNDQMAMIPSMKLSSFEKLVVGARVSKSGGAIAQNGDFYSEKSSVSKGESVDIKIDTLVSK